MKEKDPESRGWILTLPFADYDRAAVRQTGSRSAHTAWYDESKSVYVRQDGAGIPARS